MNIYSTYGLNICSEISFLGKNNIKGRPDVNILFGKAGDNQTQKIISGDGLWIGRSANETVICWKDIAKFKITNSKIIVDPEIDNDKLLNLYLFGPVMATLLHHRGLLVLHASAVKTDSGVVAFLGPSGFGKSTTAALLYDKGYQIVADDILAVDIGLDGKNSIKPGFSRLKLSSVHLESLWKNPDFESELLESGERLFMFNSNFKDDLELKKVYVLQKSLISKISKLKSQGALMQLVENSYCYIMFKDSDKVENIRQCADLIKNIDYSLLEVKRSIKQIPELIKMIENDISNIK